MTVDQVKVDSFTAFDDPAVTRVLVAEHGGFGDVGSTDPLMVTFAVTDVDLFELFG